MSDTAHGGFPYRLDEIAQKPRFGLVVLQVDETIEDDFRRLIPLERAALHVTRVASGADLTPDTIAGMADSLGAAAALLPPAAEFDVVGYGCTSATTQLGASRVEAMVREGAQTRHVTNPFTAALAAFAHLEVRRVAIVSPYIEAVSGPLATAFEGAGLTVAGSLSFGERVEARVARIAGDSVREAALRVGRAPEVQALFLSCTNLRTLDLIEPLEAQLGKPVIGSNLALAWHMATLAGTALGDGMTGRLREASRPPA